MKTKDEMVKTNVALAGAGSGSTIQGGYDLEDLEIPHVNLVQKGSESCEIFPVGTILFNREHIIGGADKPMDLAVVSIVKKFQEKTEYGSGEKGQIFQTVEDVVKAGFSPTDTTLIQKFAETTIVLAGENELLFPFEIEGRRWAPAKWVIRGAYSYGCAKAIFSFEHFQKKPASHTLWKWTVRKANQGYWASNLAATEPTSEAFRAAIDGIFAG